MDADLDFDAWLAVVHERREALRAAPAAPAPRPKAKAKMKSADLAPLVSELFKTAKRPRDIKAALAARGIEVTPTQAGRLARQAAGAALMMTATEGRP